MPSDSYHCRSEGVITLSVIKLACAIPLPLELTHDTYLDVTKVCDASSETPAGHVGVVENAASAEVPLSFPALAFASNPSPATAPVAKQNRTRPAVSSDVITLISSDCVTFTTSRTLLSIHSPFFADTFALPPPATSTGQEPLHLSLASSASLSLILAILNSVGPTPSPSMSPLLPPVAYPYWLALTLNDLPPIAEAAICADAYDIPMFSIAFIQPMLNRLSDQPLIGFALAAITGAELEEREFARRMLESGITPSSIPVTLQDSIRQYAPASLIRFTALYPRYVAAPEPLREELEWSLPVPNEVNGYAIRCRGGKRGYAPCAAFCYCRKWGPLREEAAGNVYDAVVSGAKGPIDYWAIRDVVASTVPCEKCASRLAKTFSLAVERMMAICETY